MDSNTSVLENTDDSAQPIVFRGKKRKTYRQRPGNDVENDASTSTDPIPDAPPSTTISNTSLTASDATGIPTGKDEETLSISEALRLRNLRKSRVRGGVTFGADNNNNNNGAQSGGGVEDELSLMIREEEKKAIDQTASLTSANRRFAPQTGLSGELVNKHMEEYIEAELARRHQQFVAAGSTTDRASSSATANNHPGADGASSATTADKAGDKHTALTGKLLEVDLGDEVRNRNAAMTDRARRKLAGLAVDDDDDGSAEQQEGRPKKVRLGRDGKPWRPRNRRNSDDVKRDQLVEEIMRENRLDVYDNPTPPPPDADTAAEVDADERIAEEFRREFLDAMAERQRRRKPVGPPTKPGAKKDEEVLKGPKLGGSRNTRAAMRDLLLKKEKESQGKK